MTTVPGAALSMAWFNQPITRARAERLLQGVLERAAAYNADDDKLFKISRVVVFGSFLDESVDRLGDLDVAVEIEGRGPKSHDPEAALAYARSSGRRFSNFIDRLFWARREPIMILRNQSAYICLHEEDVSQLTDRGGRSTPIDRHSAVLLCSWTTRPLWSCTRITVRSSRRW